MLNGIVIKDFSYVQAFKIFSLQLTDKEYPIEILFNKKMIKKSKSKNRCDKIIELKNEKLLILKFKRYNKIKGKRRRKKSLKNR